MSSQAPAKKEVVAAALSEAVGGSASTYNMEDIVNVCKRRGFVFQSSEIYNGFNGFYDYGPLGGTLGVAFFCVKNALHKWASNTDQPQQSHPPYLALVPPPPPTLLS